MRLTQWSDYTLRVLMYCASCQQRDQLATISEIAQAHGFSRSHLTKIVMALSANGMLETTRGRGGGLRLRKRADEINLGAVLRLTETDFNLVECFDNGQNTCRLNGACALKSILRKALDSYFEVLDQTSLADLIRPMLTSDGQKVSPVIHLQSIQMVQS
jgi:Rrf2 family nitric oxide-sensitive transcriptional repressor